MNRLNLFSSYENYRNYMDGLLSFRRLSIKRTFSFKHSIVEEVQDRKEFMKEFSGVKIEDKLQSDEFIIKSGMNFTPFRLVKNEKDVQSWIWSGTHLQENAPYSIRFKGTGMQPFIPNLSYQDVIKFAHEHFEKSETPLGIYEATEHYDLFRVSNCEIQINKDMTVDGKYCVGSLKMRDALNSSKAVNIVKGSLFNRRYRWAVEYCLKFGIIGKVVELTLFSKKVGVRNDFIVCWEVRDF